MREKKGLKRDERESSNYDKIFNNKIESWSKKCIDYIKSKKLVIWREMREKLMMDFIMIG